MTALTSPRRRPASRAVTRLPAGISLMLAGTLAVASPVTSRAERGPEPAAAPLEDLGRAFEARKLLAGAERVSALQETDASLAALLDHGVAANRRAAARFLSGEIHAQLGDYKGALESYRRATEGEGPFTDDAAFQAIRALEASGDDAEAAREWRDWEKSYARSPLLPEARLAAAWNALRRGETAEANRRLTALVAASPWMETDPRLVLARATRLYVDQRPAEALAALGAKSQGAAATFLKALCHQATGSLLRAAALFQETAERYPESPLRDLALLAKANAFLMARDDRSAAEEFARVAGRVRDPQVKAEAELRSAGALFLAGQADSSLQLFHGLVERYPGSDVAARAQFLVGEALVAQNRPAEAIVELNRVLTSYFQHAVAASAQYQIGRCLDQLGRRTDANGAYQAVVAGYPLQPEAPAAAYLAGVGLLDQNRPLAAAPYFQLVVDRYAARADSAGRVVFGTAGRQELVEAALCLLELSYHRAGNLGQLSGAPHVMLQRMPRSNSPWRAYALLIDADAAAAMARYAEAQVTLEQLTREFPDLPVAASALKLLAWTYSRQNRDSLAVATEERLLTRFGASGSRDIVSAAFLDIAHERFNQKRYREAAAAYEDFLRRFPDHPRRLTALYQAGLCYSRIDRAGNAVDRWEAIVRDSADAAIAERAWARAGDLYFQAEKYVEARRCYEGLLSHFAHTPAAALATLRLAQCEYNAGHDAAALTAFAKTIEGFPGTPEAREARRGTELALYRLSQSPNGTQVLARLVEQFPGSAFAADAQFQIGQRHYREKRYADAAEAFRRVVSQFPGFSTADQAQFLMADAYAQLKRGPEALQAYEQFLSFFPSSDLLPMVEFRLGLMHLEAKDYAPAALAFTRALEDSAATEVRAASTYNLALCQRLLGQTDEARAGFERYRREFAADARAADVAYQLGDLDEAAGRPEESLAEFERALALRPRPALEVELNFRVGRAREQKHQIEAALAAYQRAAASADRDDAFRLSAVARCAALYEARKDYARALVAYRDIARNAKDPELVAAASGRVSQLEASTRRR